MLGRGLALHVWATGFVPSSSPLPAQLFSLLTSLPASFLSPPSACPLYSSQSGFFFFFFWLYLQNVEVPGPGIEPTPQRQPQPLQ